MHNLYKHVTLRVCVAGENMYLDVNSHADELLVPSGTLLSTYTFLLGFYCFLSNPNINFFFSSIHLSGNLYNRQWQCQFPCNQVQHRYWCRYVYADSVISYSLSICMGMVTMLHLHSVSYKPLGFLQS